MMFSLFISSFHVFTKHWIYTVTHYDIRPLGHEGKWDASPYKPREMAESCSIDTSWRCCSPRVYWNIGSARGGIFRAQKIGKKDLQFCGLDERNWYDDIPWCIMMYHDIWWYFMRIDHVEWYMIRWDGSILRKHIGQKYVIVASIWVAVFAHWDQWNGAKLNKIELPTTLIPNAEELCYLIWMWVTEVVGTHVVTFLLDVSINAGILNLKHVKSVRWNNIGGKSMRWTFGQVSQTLVLRSASGMKQSRDICVRVLSSTRIMDGKWFQITKQLLCQR